MAKASRFLIMLGALIALFMCVIQGLVLATTHSQVVMASLGTLLAIIIGLLATRSDI